MIVAAVQLKHVAAIYSGYSDVVFCWPTFLLFLCIVEAQQGNYILKYHDLDDALLGILEDWGT